MPYPDELVGLPVDGPTSRAAVKLHLGIDPADVDDDDKIDQKVAAVNRLVRGLRCSTVAVDQPEWPADIVEGATMLAARLWRRKNSPAGVEAMGTLGGAYVMRNDPDIAQLLKLGSWGAPQVG